MTLPSEERQRILDLLDWSFDILQHLVPKPVMVVRQGSYTYRYREKMVEQAMVQKVARVISGLRAIEVLSQNGLFQEQAALQRVHDELTEDIFFMCLALRQEPHCKTLKQLVDAFYAEPIGEAPGKSDPPKGPDSPPRQKIRARTAALGGATADPHGQIVVAATVSRAYSSFVHASTEAIMDMYDPGSGRFLTASMLGSEFAGDHKADADNYYFRSVVAVSQLAELLQAPQVVQATMLAHHHVVDLLGRGDQAGRGM